MAEHTGESGQAQPVSAKEEFWDGARAMWPFMVSAFPMGLIAGAAGLAAGYGVFGTLGMAMAVNSGTALLASLQLLRDGATGAVVMLTVLVLSLRMAIYSTLLRPHLGQLSRRWRVLLAFGLVDAVFFAAIERYKSGLGDIRARAWYFLGASTAMYANWVTSTILGLAIGMTMPGESVTSLLDFPMTAVFVAMLAVSLTNWRMWTAGAVGAGVTFVAQALPHNLGLIAGILCGATAGAVCERLKGTQQPAAGTGSGPDTGGDQDPAIDSTTTNTARPTESTEPAQSAGPAAHSDGAAPADAADAADTANATKSRRR